MELLSVRDFTETKFSPNWTSFDYLLEVARVGQQIMQKKQSRGAEAANINRNNGNLGFIKNGKVGLKRKHPECRKGEKEEEEGKGKGKGKGVKVKRSKQESSSVVNCPNPPPPLPQDFKQHIERMGGSDLVLVIQKKLFFSDVNDTASRFSIPFSQIQTPGFLTETEVEGLKTKKSFQVCLLEPSMNEGFITFRRWNMEKSSMYVLNSTWNDVVKKNGLEMDDVVQLWSFRVGSTLCLALVKVPSKSNQE